MLPRRGDAPRAPGQQQHERRPGRSSCRGNKLPREKGCVSVSVSRQTGLYFSGKRLGPAQPSWPELSGSRARTQGPAELLPRGPQCLPQVGLAPGLQLSTGGGGAGSPSCAPGSSHTTHTLLTWGPDSEDRLGEAGRKRASGLASSEKGADPRLLTWIREESGPSPGKEWLEAGGP